jgi:predicted transcriptional regulator
MSGSEKNGPGRRAFAPSDDQRALVRRMAGAPLGKVAGVLGISVPTLRKAFAEDLKSDAGAGLFDPEVARRMSVPIPRRIAAAAGGRPVFRPSEGHRRQVMELASVGRPVKAIALAMGLSEPTLRKHFAAELETGAEKVEADIIRALIGKARGGSVAAQKHVLDMIGRARLDQMQASLSEPAATRAETPGKKLQAAIDAQEMIEGSELLAHLRIN